MHANADNLLQIAGITVPLIGFYDAPDTKPFEPFVNPKQCFFSAYNNWQQGESVLVSKEQFQCPGAGYGFVALKQCPGISSPIFLPTRKGSSHLVRL